MSDTTSAAEPASPISYWHEATQPLVNLVFVIPMLAGYELGMLWLGPQALRNGADVWLRGLLDQAGFSQYFLLPLLTCGVLLGWHHVQRQRWQVRWVVCYGMLLESICFASILLCLAILQGQLFTDLSVLRCAVAPHESWGNLLGYFGAGIYEELLFRVLLLPAFFAMLRATGLAPRASWGWAIVLSSVIFSAAHYQFDILLGDWQLTVLAQGDTFNWFSFLFRCLAGVFFSLLFLFRGFGIAAGAHALYDIFAVIC